MKESSSKSMKYLFLFFVFMIAFYEYKDMKRQLTSKYERLQKVNLKLEKSNSALGAEVKVLREHVEYLEDELVGTKMINTNSKET